METDLYDFGALLVIVSGCILSSLHCLWACFFEVVCNVIINYNTTIFTYDHRLRRTGHPVRSAIHKPQIGRSVVEWVTISESLLLYVFYFCSTIHYAAQYSITFSHALCA